MPVTPVAPLANWKVPPIGQAFDTASGGFGLISGLAAYTEGGNRAGVAHGANAQRGRHLVMVTDYIGSVVAGNKGRWMELLTLGDSDLANGILSSTPALNQLRGREAFVADPVPQGVDVPDFASQLQHVFMADGEQRMQGGPSGFGANLVTRGHVIATGPALFNTWAAAIRSQTGDTVFVDLTNDTNSVSIDVTYFPGLSPTVADSFYLGRTAPWLELSDHVTPIIDGVGTWTLAFEYFNGSTWSALPGLVDNTTLLTNLSGATPPDIEWQLPDDWAPTTINGQGPFFYMRIRIVTITTPITTVPGFRQVGANRELITTPVILEIGVGTNDAYYWGFETPYADIWVKLGTSGAHSGGTFVWEHWNGTSWATFVPVDNTSDFTVAITTTDWFLVNFNPASPKLPRNLTDVTGEQSLFWIRYRPSVAPTVTTEPATTINLGTGHDYQDRAAGLQAILSPSYTGAAYHIPDDPGTVTPRVVGWGIPLPENIGATASGLHTFWDPISKVRSRRFNITALANGGSAGGFLIPPYGNANVTQIAQWSDATEAATLEGTFDLDSGGEGQIDQLDTSTADVDIIAGEEGGPPTTANENLTGLKRRDDAGTFASCAVHRDRMWCAVSNVDGFANRVIFSGLGRPHNFPGANVVSVDIDDGDRIIGIRALRDVLVVFKNRSIHFILGNPGEGNLQVKRVADFGSVAKRSAVVIGNFLFFLSQRGVESITGSGALQPIPHSQPIRDLVRNLTPDALAQASATYDARDGLYLLSAPGIQAQMPDANGPGETVNDGLLVYHVDSGLWGVYTGLFVASLASFDATSQTREVALGGFWGRIRRLSETLGEEAEGQVVSGVTYRGVLTTTTSATALVDGLATWLDSDPGGGDDRRMIGLWVHMRTGAAAGQRRMIVQSRSATTRLDVFPAFDDTPSQNDEYEIGAWAWVWESGDWDFGQPDSDYRLQDVVLHMERQLADENVIDVAVSNADEGDSGEGTDVEFAPGTVEHLSTAERVQLPQHSGATQRLRLQGTVRQRRPRIKALTFNLDAKGSADG